MTLLSKKFLVSFICKKRWQLAMHKLYLFAATGMNYGNANTLDLELTGEKKVIEFVKEKLARQQQITVFDVGANAGNYSIMVTGLLGEKKTVIYAFEPSKHNYGPLTNNVKNISNILPFNFGLGKISETVSLYSNYEGSGAASLYIHAFEKYRQNRHVLEEIHIQTLEDFCRNKSVDTIDLLKIDVEGHELFVLEGGSNMIKNKQIKFIQFEFGPFHVYSKTFFKDFWDLLSPGYTIHRIISDGLFEITTYSENLEIFRTSNFLAVLK